MSFRRAVGKVFSEASVAPQVTMPDQRALLHFEAGIEQLVFATLFRIVQTPKNVAFLALLFLGASGLLLLVTTVDARLVTRLGDSSEVTREAGVTVHERQRVGIFETATISADDPQALPAWLTRSGFSIPQAAGPVMASYAKEGWVFVAAKLSGPLTYVALPKTPVVLVEPATTAYPGGD